MAIHARYKIPVFWDDEYKLLDYQHESFNDAASIARWTDMGYSSKFTGHMADMRTQQPSWNNQFINIYQDLGWQAIGTSYYRMDTGTVLPTHSDLYTRYVTIHNLSLIHI